MGNIPTWSDLIEARFDKSTPASPPARKYTPPAQTAAVRAKVTATRKAQYDEARQDALEEARARAIAPTANVWSIPIDHLVVEHTFQAPLQQSRVDAIVKKYDERLFGVLCVARLAAECYSVLDGQHRKVAAEALTFTHVPCEDLGEINYEERARIFRERNLKRRTPPFGILFRSMVEQKDEHALAIIATLEHLGLTLDYGHLKGPEQPGTIRAVRSVYDLYDRGGGVQNLTRVVGTLKHTVGGQPGAYSNYLLAGLNSLFVRYPDLDRMRLLTVLRRAGVRGIWDTAAERGPSLQREKPTAIAYALWWIYNEHLTKGRLGNFVVGRIGPTVPGRNRETAHA